jgi:predicted RNase H-like HicB family nuclease
VKILFRVAHYILVGRGNWYNISKVAVEARTGMVTNYTAKYTKISSGYMGQIVEWPEVITEGRTLEECREMLKDALKEMILAYKQQAREIPLGGGLLEQMPIEA